MTDSDQAVLEDPRDAVQDQIQDQAEPDLGYRVEIEAFSGPMDLLLYLVRRAEVEIWDIPIATITDQFIDTIRQWEEMDLDLAGDFILMAATLLEIKSRAIAPVEESEAITEDDDELIDPRADLVRQLLAFRACKDWADRLEGCQDAHRQRHARRYNEDIPDAPEDEDGCDLENADPYQLFRLWDKILADITGKGPRTVIYDDIPIADRMRQIESTMREAGEGRFSWLIQGAKTRIQQVGIFVALLNCVRKRSLEAIQHEQYADVLLHYIPEHQRKPPAELPQESDTSNADPDGSKKRRRRGPVRLMTYQAPISEEGEQELIPEVEELITVETDEDRFRRQLESETGCDSVLGVIKDFDAQMHEHLVLRGICQGPLPAGVVAEAEAPVAELPEEAAESEGASETVEVAVEVPAG